MISDLPGITVEGHALVSVDGMIAGADNRMPPALRHDADWQQFQAALDRAEIVVSGRKGHEMNPNPTRKRLVLTRSVSGLQPDIGRATLWNPAGMSLGAALRQLGVTSGVVTVAGAFDAFVEFYDVFVLAEMHRLAIPDGVPCFSGGHPRVVLPLHGLQAGPLQVLDSDLTLTRWQRP